MKRLGRRLGRALPFLYSLVSILTVCLWIRSHWAADTFAWSGVDSIAGFSSDGLLLYAYVGSRYMPNRDGFGWLHFAESPSVRPIDRMDCLEEARSGYTVW